MLYSEFTSMEMMLGRAIDTSSGNTGFVFIKVSFMGKKLPFLKFPHKKSHTTAA